jgi:hypothetical protein
MTVTSDLSDPGKLRQAAEEARTKADEAYAAGLGFFARALRDHATLYEGWADAIEGVAERRRAATSAPRNPAPARKN